MSEVSPNLVKLEFPTTTSVKLDWSINGDTPPSITIKDECSGVALITLTGDIGGTFTLQNLPAKQQYRLFLQSNYADGPRNSNAIDRYPGQPCAPAKPQTLFPALSTQNFPKTLNDTNKIVVTCVNANSFAYWIISVNGAQQPDQLSGSQTFQFPSVPQQPFAISADGYISPNYSGWSPPISVKGGPNSNSVKDFLHNSGVDGMGGLLTFIKSSHSTSVRNMLGL
jgi:hypothetical protein